MKSCCKEAMGDDHEKSGKSIAVKRWATRISVAVVIVLIIVAYIFR